MSHPNQPTLALHSSGDLNWFARWKTERHLAGCAQCRDEVAAFREMREALPDLAELPAVPWNRIAAEMRANIRLGLAAGECVREVETRPRTPLFNAARAVIAFAGVFALLVTGMVLERPTPSVMSPSERTVQAVNNGIQVRAGDRAFGLMHSGVACASGATCVVPTASAPGSAGEQFVDENGYVAQIKMYVE
jgi:hypothetical protein